MTSRPSRKRAAKPAARKAPVSSKRKTPKAITAPEKSGIIQRDFIWRDILIAVSYQRDWIGSKDSVAHLEIHVCRPRGAIIPLTDTGYRSHFVSSVYVEAAGGPLAFVKAWLDVEAATPAWKRREDGRRGDSSRTMTGSS